MALLWLVFLVCRKPNTMSYYYKSFAYLLILVLSIDAAAQVQVQQLGCDDRIEPIGLGKLRPGLSWQLEGKGRLTSNEGGPGRWAKHSVGGERGDQRWTAESTSCEATEGERE